MTKPIIIYTALTKAIDGFNERKHVCRGHLADALGYKGQNASIQFSNALSLNADNKMINHEKEELLLHAFDDAAVKEYFSLRMRGFGLRPVAIFPVRLTIVKLHDAIDDAMIEGNEAFNTTKKALADKTLTADELRAIIKENLEASAKYNEIVDMAIASLETDYE